jgi:hypothetical protein
MPGRFVRQAVGMLLAVQESPSLFAAHPQLVDLIGCEPGSAARARTAGVPISPLRLYLSVYSGRWSYFTQPADLAPMFPAPRAGAATDQDPPERLARCGRTPIECRTPRCSCGPGRLTGVGFPL